VRVADLAVGRADWDAPSHRGIVGAAAEKRPLREGDYVPACVESCPAGAMFFGDLDDASNQVSRLVHSPRAFRLLEDLGTEPRVFYLREGE
jgi:molybdopterin-containing oxidoreductase family iron-sulfur binding subunit